jgi:hypothetical protein
VRALPVLVVAVSPALSQGKRVKDSQPVRRYFLLFLVTVLFLLIIDPAQAQQPAKISWIGYLAGAGSGPSPAFIQGLRDLGYVEGRNIGFVYRTAEGESGRYADLAAELVRLQVDILLRIPPAWPWPSRRLPARFLL